MPFPYRQIPNLITGIRIALVFPIAVALIHDRLAETLLLFAAAAASDAADGFLAKRFGWRTPQGAVLDPAADKLLLATVYVTLMLRGDVPAWLTATVVGRDVIIVAGAITYRIWIGALTMRPSAISKLNTLVQVAFVLAVISERRFGFPPEWAIVLQGAAVLVTSVVSGIDYVLTFGRQAQDERHRARAAAPGGEASRV